jgi:hypothetical protein
VIASAILLFLAMNPAASAVSVWIRSAVLEPLSVEAPPRLDEPLPQTAEPAVAEPPSEAPAATATPVAPAASSDDEPPSLSTVGLAGIIVGAAGLGLAASGIVRMAEGETRMLDPNNHELLIVTNPRPQGQALLGAGVGVVAVGVAMLAVDLTVLRKRRAGRVAVAPSFGRGAAGLHARVRF